MQKALTPIPLTAANGGVAAPRTPPRWTRPAALAAAIFGVATIISGAATLFGPQEIRAASGAIVQFVLWFNFLAGFAYLVGAYALYRGLRWAPGAAALIAGATAIVAIAFIVYTLAGGAFSWRTPGALLLRFGFWAAIAWGMCRSSGFRRRDA